MKSLQRGFTAVEMTVVLLVVVGLGGWIANIVKLVGMDFGSISGMLVVRAIGIFVAPLGAVMGFV
jgi:prepilin-type N-terminal cleavage/methylation domain-containing protein